MNKKNDFNNYRIVFIADASVRVALNLSSVVSLLALEADVVGVPLERKAFRVVEESRALRRHGLALGQAFVLESHQGFLLDVVVKDVDRVQQLAEGRMSDAGFADRAVSEPERDSRSGPAFFENHRYAEEVENVAALL